MNHGMLTEHVSRAKHKFTIIYSPKTTSKTSSPHSPPKRHASVSVKGYGWSQKLRAAVLLEINPDTRLFLSTCVWFDWSKHFGPILSHFNLHTWRRSCFSPPTYPLSCFRIGWGFRISSSNWLVLSRFAHKDWTAVRGGKPVRDWVVFRVAWAPSQSWLSRWG